MIYRKILALILSVLFIPPYAAMADVSVPSTAETRYVPMNFNRLDLYLLDGIYFADSDANTMLVQAPDLADDLTVFKFPATNGTENYGLLTDGTGTTSWGEVLLPGAARDDLAAGTANYVVVNDASGLLSEEQYLDKSRGGAGADMSSVTFPSTGTIPTVPAAGVVKSDGSALSSSDVDLTTEVTGILPKANGGTGADNSSVTFPASGAILTADGTATVTGKTIDADANTITNITNDEIRADAAIARSKIKDGTADHVVINGADGLLSSEAQLAIARGGTGQSTATAAFDALAPAANPGALIVKGALNYEDLPVGEDDQVLIADSAESLGVRWGTVSSGSGSGETNYNTAPDDNSDWNNSANASALQAQTTTTQAEIPLYPIKSTALKIYTDDGTATTSLGLLTTFKCIPVAPVDRDKTLGVKWRQLTGGVVGQYEAGDFSFEVYATDDCTDDATAGDILTLKSGATSHAIDTASNVYDEFDLSGQGAVWIYFNNVAGDAGVWITINDLIVGPGTAINAATITGGEEYTPGNVNNWGTDASGTRGVWNSEGAYINLRVSAELNTPSGLLTWSASNFMPQGYTIDESLLNSTTITDRDLVGTWVALDQTQGYSGNVVYDRGEDLVYFLTSEASINATGPVPASANWGGSSSITMFLEKIPVNELRGEGTTPLAKINSQSPIKAGFVGVWPTANIPDGWLLADGSAVSRTTYAELFAVYGTTYGAGDGSTTFNLPDYSGYVLAGVDADGSTLTGATLGADLGSETHTLTEAELPAHTHSDGTLAAALDGAHTHESVYVGSSGTASIDTGSNNHIIYRSCTGSSNCDATGNQGGGGLNANYWLNGTSSTPNSGETTTDGNHTHDITGATGSTGSGTAFSVVQPTKPVYWIVKAYNDRIEFAGLNEATAEKRGLVGPGTIDDPAFFGAGAVDSAAIDDGTITTDDISASAAIPYSKLSFSNNIVAGDIATDAIGTLEIDDGAIANADISSSAGIDKTKIAWASSSTAASAGDIGEYKEANGIDEAAVCGGYEVSTSLSLGAGHWMVGGTVVFNSGGTNVQRLIAGVSLNTTSIDSVNSGGYQGIGQATGAIPDDIILQTGLRRFALSATDTVYLIAYVECSTAPNINNESHIFAWRID